jgi:hypothetical protein
MRAALAFVSAVSLSTAQAQSEETRTLELEGGAKVAYTLHLHPAGAHVAPLSDPAPTSALNTARLLSQHLAAGDLTEAALLSNSPRRRFEVLRDYRESVGEEEFKRVFAQYLSGENRLLAEIAIDRHRLLIWQLALNEKSGAAPVRVAGQYFVEIEGRYLVDDVPNDVRTRLRWVLEAYRAGKIARPAP